MSLTKVATNVVREAKRLKRINWDDLSGICCIYKPESLSVKLTRHTVLNNLCRDLNANTSGRPIAQRVEISGATNVPMEVSLVPDLSDHPLVVGPRYVIEDFKAVHAKSMGNYTSGVFLLGINDATSGARKLFRNKLTRTYKVSGVLGRATENYHCYGKVVEKATYNKVTRVKIDRIVAHMQSMHQKKMYELSGVDMNTQAGFELAAMGPIKPLDDKIPVIYGMKCVHFEPPYFTIEIHCVNEYELYLHTLIHEIGIQLHSAAFCSKTQCIRDGYFTLEHALLRKHWTLDNILQNFQECNKVFIKHDNLLNPTTPKLM